MQSLAFLRALFLARTHLALENPALRQEILSLKYSGVHLGGLHYSYRLAA